MTDRLRPPAPGIYARELSPPAVLKTLSEQNKPHGFACVSYAWAKPADYHPAEFCENGAKATMWEMTSRRCGPEFFAKNTVTALREWRDYDLEQQGRLTHPLRDDPATDHYVQCSWDEAFAAIVEGLHPHRAIPARKVTFTIACWWRTSSRRRP